MSNGVRLREFGLPRHIQQQRHEDDRDGYGSYSAVGASAAAGLPRSMQGLDAEGDGGRANKRRRVRFACCRVLGIYTMIVTLLIGESQAAADPDYPGRSSEVIR